MGGGGRQRSIPKALVEMSNGILMNQTNKQNLDLSNAKVSLAMNREDSSLGNPRLLIITKVH